LIAEVQKTFLTKIENWGSTTTN